MRRPRPRSDRSGSGPTFLRYEDSDGRHVDFHTLRHTRGVWLFEHHKAEGRNVQELLGVGSLGLVDRCSRSYKPEHGDVVKRGPELPVLPQPTMPAAADLLGRSVLPPGSPLPSSLYRSLLQDPEIRRILTHGDGPLTRWTSTN